MSIASRIEAIEQHLTDDYSVLEVAGADLTNVDKNILNLKPTWQERLLYFINNGTDVVWNNWEKVEGTGETITLNNTEEAPMKINLKGNTSQETTTGKNLLENTLQSQTANGITFIRNNDGSLTFSGTATQAHSITGRFTKNLVLRAGTTYILSLGNKQAGYGVYLQQTGNVNVYYLGVSATNSSLTITPTEDTIIQQLAIHFPNGNTVNGTIYPMIRLASITNDTYEPYTGGQASPNPQYPQDIHVVSGDNSINVCGKNLFHFESQRNTGWYSDVPNMIKEIGVYTLSINDTSLSGVWAFWFVDNNGDRIGNFIKPSSSVSTPSTFNVTQEQANAPYIRILPNASGLHDIQNYKIQIEKGNEATTYEPYIGNTYGINLGKNLIPFSDIISTGGTTSNGITFTLQTDGTIKANGTATTGVSIYLTTNYIEQNAGTYTFSDGIVSGQSGTTFFLYADVRHLDGTSWDAKSFSTAETTTRTRTIEEAFKFKPRIVIRQGQVLNNLIFKPQLEKGSQATTYAPYKTPIELCKIGDYQDKIYKDNGKWYFHKEIGKITYDGTENWGLSNNVFYKSNSTILQQGNIKSAKSNYFQEAYNQASTTNVNTYNPDNSICGSTAGTNRFYIKCTSITSIDNFKTWLSTHNTTAYYVLSTPTTTEITDATLLSQLEALNGARSYTTQTNISQENNDKPFILDVTALKQLT